MSDVKRQGEACVEWVERSIRLACVLEDEARAAEAAEAARRVAAARDVLERFAEFERTVRNMHESSTSLAHLQRDLRQLDAELPDTPPDPAALAAALAPHDPLADVRNARFEVDFLGIRPSATWDSHAVLTLRNAAGAWTLHVWTPWRIDGTPYLLGASVEETEHGVRLVAGDRSLALRGPLTVVPGAESSPVVDRTARAEPWQTRAWSDLQAVVDLVNARARWDYDLEESDEPHALAFRGKSGAYDDGGLLTCLDVVAARVNASFSHATFSLLKPEDVPAELRPSTTGWILLGIEAEARSSSSSRQVVVCRGLRFEDEGVASREFVVRSEEPSQARSTPRPLVGYAIEHREETRAAAVSFASIPAPDKTPQGRALWALREFVPAAAGTPADARQLSHLVPALVRALDLRVPLGPDADARVVDPFAAAATRDAQRNEAHELLRLASAYGASGLGVDPQAVAALDDDALEVTTTEPADDLQREARAEVVQELVRRQLGLEPRGVALDLEHRSVGRMLADPAAEARLSADEKLARAAALVVMDPAKNGSPVGLDVLLPDPAMRARVAAAVPLVNAAMVRVPPVADLLARNGALDRFEVTALLDRDEELREWYVLLRALLRGHRAFPSP